MLFRSPFVKLFAFVRTKLKSLTNGKVIDNTFPSGHKIDIVRVERRKFQFLYKDDMGFHFMNTEIGRASCRERV